MRHAAPRLFVLTCVLVTVASMMAVATTAQAAPRFYWYGENSNTCWQKTGEVAAETQLDCDYVGEWFLNSSNPVRTLEGALSGDLNGQITQSGDYCNAYSKQPPVGPMYTRDGNNESGLTGFNPSPPDSMTTANGDFLCQAAGSQWGQGLRPAHVPGNCVGNYQPCGVHHFVSFVGQNQGLRPWSRSFASGPIFIVEGAAYPGRVNVPGGGWAYLCPILEDVGSSNGQLLEYCFVEWEKSGYVNYRGLVNQAPISSPVDGHRMCQLFTAFQLGTSFSTEIAGSGNTYTIGESPWIGPFKAGITEGNMLNAIRAANAQPCAEGLSEDLSKYALIGVEQGIEAANIGEFGARTEGLSLSTEYSSLNVPPRAATQPTTEWKATSAQLHGSVNPEGTSTEAFFEYSTEPSFAHSTKFPVPGWQIGSGMTYIPAYVTVEGLTPNTTYYDRVVGRNKPGTGYGEAAQFHTLAAPPSATTGSATEVSETQVSLHGTLNPNGSDTHYRFQYGKTTSYGSSTAEVDAGSGTVSVAAESAIGSLLPNTVYHYRIVASNGSGTVYGEDRTFELTPAPTVTDVKPGSGPTTGGTTVTIVGTGLYNATAVKFGGVSAASFNVVSSTSITAVTPVEEAGTADVTVTTPGGTSAIGTPDRFKFTPAITSLTPNAGPKGGGTKVTVKGTGFGVGQTATKFKFDGTLGTAVNCASSTQCTVTSSTGAVGTVDVKATVNKAVSPKVTGDQFTYS